MKKLLMVVWVLSGIVIGQPAPKSPAAIPLKEYSYPSDGFAAKFPYEPEPHTDSVHSDFKVWTVKFGHQAGVSIRLKLDSQPCDVALEKLKSMAKSQDLAIREFTVSGRPAWEEEEWVRNGSMVHERYVCGQGRYYVLTFVWPVREPRPALGIQILDSFRLLK